MADGLCMLVNVKCFFFFRYLPFRYVSETLYLAISIRGKAFFLSLRICINDHDLYGRKVLAKQNVYQEVAKGM